MKKPRFSGIYVGTSGYSYQHWKSRFYPKNLPASKWLEFYSQHFNTVELNYTFYRLPQKKAFQNWHQKTPKNFKFVIKGSRFITHIKRLKDCASPLKEFFKRASSLKEKLACCLWQLPPSFKYDLERLDKFVRILQKNHSAYLHTFEFREKSWFNPQTYSILDKNNISLCIADAPDFKTPDELASSFIYLRFHGGKILYGSQYSDKELIRWAKKAKKWLGKKKLLFAFFNNDAQSFAVKNALKFKELLNENL
jgi:uncharacterized protein YecE (DUF72 family)